MSVEESEVIFQKFKTIFEESKLYHIDEYTHDDKVARYADRFKRLISHTLIQEFSTTKVQKEEGYDRTFRLLSEEEREAFEEMLNSAVERFVVEIKQGKGDEVFTAEKKKDSLLTRFLLGMATLGVYEIYYRVTYNQKAQTKFEHLVEFCQKKKLALETEYRKAAGSFPRPKEYGLFYRLFGGKTRAQEFDERLAAHEEKLKNYIIVDTAARKIQNAFRRGKNKVEAREGILSRIDKRDRVLEKQKQQMTKRMQELGKTSASLQVDIRNNRKAQIHLQEQEKEADALDRVWQTHVDKEKMLMENIALLDQERQMLEKRIKSDAPMTWGVLNRAGAKAKEEGRIQEINGLIAKSAEQRQGLEKDLHKIVKARNLVEDEIYKKRVELDVRQANRKENLAAEHKELLEKYSHVKKSEKKVGRAEGNLVQQQQGLSGYRKIIQARQDRADGAMRTYRDSEIRRKQSGDQKHQK